MNRITHKYLRELWLKQNEQDKKWRGDLISGAFKLRDLLTQKLDAPEGMWKDRQTGRKYRYIEVVSLITKEKPLKLGELFDSMTPKGELPVGLSVTLDREENSYPKTLFNIPVALKFENGELQFSSWNLTLDAPEQWTSNIDEFVSGLLKKLENFFKHDPYTGFNEKSKFGFV